MTLNIENNKDTYREFHPLAIGTIDDYPSASYNNDPLLYPGVRPESSFLLDNNDVFSIDCHASEDELAFKLTDINGGQIDLDDFLIRKGTAPMADRIPILGYGANMCPASIKSKFTKIGREDAAIVPTIYGQLTGYDVVWSGGPGVNGNFIANLYKGDETQSTKITIGVNFLTQEQLLVMHATELSYDLTTVTVNIDGVLVKALVYTGVDDILIEDAKPVAVTAIKAEGRTINAKDTRKVLEEMLVDAEVKAALVEQDEINSATTADEYVEESKRLMGVPGAKLARKKVVHSVMKSLGKSRTFKLPVYPSGLRSWANPSTIPTYKEQREGIYHNDVYELAHETIPKGSWEDETQREKVLKGISTHFLRLSGLEEKK